MARMEGPKTRMEHDWIEFDERQRRGTDGYYATLNGEGSFVINRLLFEAMEQPEAVTLHFDPKNDCIGMRKANTGLQNAFCVRERRSGGRIVRARGFIKKWDIRLTGTYSFPDPKIDDGMLILPLNSRFNVSRGTR